MAAVVSKQNKFIIFLLTAACCAMFVVYLRTKIDNVCKPQSAPSGLQTEEDVLVPEEAGLGSGLAALLTSPLDLFWSSPNKVEPKHFSDTLCSEDYMKIISHILQEHLINDVLSGVLVFIYIMQDFIVTFSDFLQSNFQYVGLALLVLGIFLVFTMRLTWKTEEKGGHQSSIFNAGDLGSRCKQVDDSISQSENVMSPNRMKITGASTHVGSQRTPGFYTHSLITSVTVVLLSAASLSIPWEFIRLYQKAVAERASRILMGTPAECHPQTMTIYESIKSLLRHHFSWKHDLDPCHDYHYALLVDPLWEVTPLMVLSSVFTRCLLHPVEITCSTLGRGIRSFFSEIPAQWQPLIMLVIMATSLVTTLMLCRYRLAIPMFLRIEPRSPVHASSSCNGGSHSQRTVTNNGNLKCKICDTKDSFSRRNYENQNFSHISAAERDLYTRHQVNGVTPLRAERKDLKFSTGLSRLCYRTNVRDSYMNGGSSTLSNGYLSADDEVPSSAILTRKNTQRDKKEMTSSFLDGSGEFKGKSHLQKNIVSKKTVANKSTRKSKQEATKVRTSKKKLNVDISWRPKQEVVEISDSD